MSASAIGACDRGTGVVEPAPPGPPLHVVGTSPRSGQTDVALDAAIRVRFDRFLHPNTTVRQSIRVTGGTPALDGGASPAGEETFAPEYDVVERVVVYRNVSSWQPGIRYTVTLWAPDDEPSHNGFQAWDGAKLETSVTFEFTTTSDTSNPVTDPPPRSGDFGMSYCSQCAGDAAHPGVRVWLPGIAPILGTSCGFSNCHAPIADVPGVSALDLSTAQGMLTTAIGKPAHESLTLPSSRDALATPTLFGRGMPLIDPKHPANSFLLYKVLINPQAYVDDPSQTCATDPPPACGDVCAPTLAPCGCIDTHGVTLPCTCAGRAWRCDGDPGFPSGVPQSFPSRQRVDGPVAPSLEEIARLRAVITGGPMPYGTDETFASVGGSFALTETKLLQAWISANAPLTDTCPDGADSQTTCDAPGIAAGIGTSIDALGGGGTGGGGGATGAGGQGGQVGGASGAGGTG